MRQARDRQRESLALSDSNPDKSVANIFRHRSSSKRGYEIPPLLNDNKVFLIDDTDKAELFSAFFAKHLATESEQVPFFRSLSDRTLSTIDVSSDLIKKHIKGHLDAPSLALLAPAGLCPLLEARPAGHAGDKCNPAYRRMGRPSPRHLQDADSFTVPQGIPSNELSKRLANFPVAVAAADVNASVEDRLCQLRGTVQSTALTVLCRAHRQRQNWFEGNDTAISILLAKQNRLHKTYLNRSTEENNAAFFRSCHLVQQGLREIRKVWAARKVEEIQGAAYGPAAKGTATLLSADGTTLLTEKTQILQRWAECFIDFLNRLSTISDAATASLPRVKNNADLDHASFLHETNKVIQYLFSRKVPGSDAIPAEIYKHDGP
ncbi:hypothetical protein SprV_0100227000 [Sparganum proliferum]